MEQKEQLQLLGAKAWDFRKQTGFTKSLPHEIQREAANLADKGFTNLIIARALGVTKSSVAEWRKKYPRDITGHVHVPTILQKLINGVAEFQHILRQEELRRCVIQKTLTNRRHQDTLSNASTIFGHPSIRLHPKIIQWAKKQAKRRGVGYQTSTFAKR